MKPEIVLETLQSYRENLGRCEYLRIELAEAEKVLNDLEGTAREDAAAPGAQNLTGMPRGNAVGNPTERIAMMFASGGEPRHISELREEISKKWEEYRTKQKAADQVDAWMRGLNDRERWIVLGQVVDGLTWRELMREHETRFGEPRTKEALRRLREKSMEKIYRMAS